MRSRVGQAQFCGMSELGNSLPPPGLRVRWVSYDCWLEEFVMGEEANAPVEIRIGLLLPMTLRIFLLRSHHQPGAGAMLLRKWPWPSFWMLKAKM